jgi:hypothetical protein
VVEKGFAISLEKSEKDVLELELKKKDDSD